MRREEVDVPVMTLPTGLSDHSFERDEKESEKIRTQYGAVSYTHLDVYKRQRRDRRYGGVKEAQEDV